MSETQDKTIGKWGWILLTATLWPCSIAWCGEMEGTWQGLLDVGLLKFRVALVVKKGAPGKPEVFFNNIDDGLFDQPAALLSSKVNSLEFRLKKGQLLTLRLNSKNNCLSGTYLQAQGNFEKEGVSSPLTLESGKDYLFPRLDSKGRPVTEYQYQTPMDRGDGWRIGTLPLSAVSLMESGVKKILNGTFPHIHSLLVAQGEKLLVDETFYGYSAQDPQPVQSITKSVFSILFGITQDRHLLQTGLKLYDYFPEYRSQKAWDSRKNQITLGNLLTMSSGFDCSDWKDAQACSWGMVNSNDWLDFVLSKPLAGDPGSHFSYCGACLLPLSVILERAGQKTIPQFAQQYLFDPLEIHSTRWVEAPSAGTKVVPVSFGLSISPRDLAKIGLLVLKQGEWEGQRIVSEDWIKESTSLKVPRGQTNHKYDYGYLWWETEFKIGNRNIRTVMGWGVGGNYLLIVPEKNLVFVITAGNTNDPQAAKCSLRLFQDYVLPAFFPLAQDKRNLG